MSIACHFFVVFVKQLGYDGEGGPRQLAEMALVTDRVVTDRVVDRPYAGLVAAVVGDACGALATAIDLA